MRTIDALRQAVSKVQEQRVKLVTGIGRFVELFLVLGGSSLAVLAGFLGGDKAWPPEPTEWIGIIGVLLALVGGVASWRAKEPVTALAEAQEALDQLSDSRLRFRQMADYLETLEKGLTRMRSLYVAYSSARGALETATTSGLPEVTTLVGHCLQVMKSDLRIAFGFEMTDEWTVGVYVREIDPSDGQVYLRLIAHDRSTDCEVSTARRWKLGVGVGGMALAKDVEVVAPDIQAHDARGLFQLHGDVVRPDDLSRYRSMIGIPVRVQDDDQPWGIVLASSSQPGHFGYDDDQDRQRPFPEEAARVLAGVVALTVAMCRQKDPEAVSRVTDSTLAEGG